MYIALSCIPSPYPLTLPPKKNKCMKKTKLFILFICACMALPAQEKGKRPLWKVELAGALNNYDAWEVEPSVAFLPLDYVGASLGLMFIRPYQGVIRTMHSTSACHLVLLYPCPPTAVSTSTIIPTSQACGLPSAANTSKIKEPAPSITTCARLSHWR